MSAVELDGLCPRQDGRTPGRAEAAVAVELAEEERREPKRRNPETGSPTVGTRRVAGRPGFIGDWNCTFTMGLPAPEVCR